MTNKTVTVPVEQLEFWLKGLFARSDEREIVDEMRTLLAAAPKQAQVREAEDFEELLGEYWGLAYSEGKDGVSHGDKANEVLHKLHSIYRASIQPQPQAVDEREANWLIFFDDADRRPEIFTSEAAARARFEHVQGAGWNCHLFTEARASLSAQPTPVAWRMVTPEAGNIVFLTDASEAKRFSDMDGREVRALVFATQPTPVAPVAAEQAKSYSRDEVQKWRDDIAHAAADMAHLALGDEWNWLIANIRQLAAHPAAVQRGEQEREAVDAKIGRFLMGLATENSGSSWPRLHKISWSGYAVTNEGDGYRKWTLREALQEDIDATIVAIEAKEGENAYLAQPTVAAESFVVNGSDEPLSLSIVVQPGQSLYIVSGT